MELKHCWGDKYGNYDSVEDAKAACSLDPNCQSVYDRDCDDSTNDVYLCPLGSSYENSSSSCIYDRPGISYQYNIEDY